MKNILLIALFLGLSTYSFAQNRIGLEFGASGCTFSGRSDNQTIGSTQSVIIKPNVALSYMRKLDRHVYLGVKLGLEANSFFYSKTNGTKVQIDHNSSYFTVAPTVDFGLGRYQYMHIFIAMNMGFLTNGNQTTSEYINAAAPAPYTTYNSASTISSFIFRPGFGLKQHFPISKMWHVTMSEAFYYMATDLTHLGNTNDEAIHPGYFSLQMGIMRKFHRPKHHLAVKE